MNTLEQFIQDNRLVMTVEPTETNPNMDTNDFPNTSNWSRGAKHYRVHITRRLDGKPNQSMTLFYSMGSALTHEPTLSEVLDCLASDASSVENTGRFEEFASDMGYDIDSRRAEKTYNACVTQSAELKALLGDEAYSTLLWDTERL